MRIDHMRELIELVRTKSYSKTADKFFLTQSAVSKHIAAMEAEFDVSLFRKDIYGIELTKEGKFIYQEFSRIIEIYDNMENEVLKMKDGLAGSFKLGILYYTTDLLFSSVLKSFRQSYPNISVQTFSGQPDLIYESLIKNAIDVGVLVMTDDEELDDLKFVAVSREKRIVLCRRDNILVQNPQPDIFSLSGQTLLRYENGDYLKKRNDMEIAWLNKAGVKFQKIIYLDNIDLLSTMIKETNAIAILPEHIIAFHNKLASVEVKDLPMDTICICCKKENANPSVKLFFEELGKRRNRAF